MECLLDSHMECLLTANMNFRPVLPAKSPQSCPALCDTIDHSLQGSSVHGILQARILEWIAMPSSRDLPHPGMELAPLMSPALAGRFFTTSTTWEALVIMPILSEAEYYTSSHELLLHPLLHMLLVL